MNTRELLEQDKDRLMSRLKSADEPARAIAVLEDELNRIAVRYSEKEESSHMSEDAGYALSAAKAAVALVDSAGEVQAYELAKPVEKTPSGAAVPLTIGACASAGGGLVLVLSPKALMILGLILIAAGAAALVYGGYLFGKSKGRHSPASARGDQILSATLDSEKIYRNLASMLSVIDRNLDDLRIRERMENELPDAENLDASPIPEDELQLLSVLVESAYTRKDDDDAADIISEIRFYLHQKEIDMVDYSSETERWFNKMPSKASGTLRPAFVCRNKVLLKGLAAGGI